MKMNINRNNYESFFLLYVDNELSAADRKVVELFVKENPDLGDEFMLLQQSTLSPDHNVVFDNKEFLMKSAGESFINYTNYEEFFLLYVDNELSKAQRREVEAFASNDRKLLAELTSLQRSRLLPDNEIVFEGKEKLYRKDEERKILPLPWLRIAAAAAVLIFVAGLLVSKYASVKSSEHPVAIQNKDNFDANSTKKEQAPVTSTSGDTLHQTEAKNSATAVREKKQAEPTKKYLRNLPDTKMSNQNNIAMKETKNNDEQGVQEKDISKVNLEQAIVKNENTTAAESIALSQMVALDKSNIVVQSDLPEKNGEDNISAGQLAIADQTKNPEDQVSIMSFSTKKSRMRGVFRKVSRVFEKTTNADDNRHSMLIGNFQIALK
jgi:hypothetical protein